MVSIVQKVVNPLMSRRNREKPVEMGMIRYVTLETN